MPADDIRKQVNVLFKQAVDQLEEVKEVLSGRLEEDLLRLRHERDRLLKRLGEQTYRLANQGKIPVPTVVKRTVDRLNDVIGGMVKQQAKARKTKKKTAQAPAKKARSAKERPARKTKTTKTRRKAATRA